MAESNLKRNKDGYGYKYTDLAQIHEYLEKNKMKYIQYIDRIEGDDYIMTKRYMDGKWEENALRGCRVVQAILQGKNNPAQEQGSALTYARRYSLLMAFGLATEDDDGKALDRPTPQKQQAPVKQQNAAAQQADPNKEISDDRAKAFQEWCNSNGINDDILYPTLESFGYTFISDIKNKDLKKITVELEKLVKGEI